MIINVHAGHNPSGKIACGAVGFLDESDENRRVVTHLIKYLKANGHTVYNCTVDNGTGQTDVLKKIVRKCNQHKVNLDISIHFNSGACDKKGNKKTTGTEVIVYRRTSKAKSYATKITKKIADLGFTNRGVKTNNSLYYLKHSAAPALLVECCFVDDKDDAKLYNAKKMAKAIADAIGKA